MHMTFEKIDPPAPPAKEHPLVRCARMIIGYHQETIDKIDGGFQFTREGVDCNDELRAECVGHIAECEALLLRAEHGDPTIHNAAMVIMAEAKSIDDDEAGA